MAPLLRGKFILPILILIFLPASIMRPNPLKWVQASFPQIDLFSSLKLEEKGLNRRIFEAALSGYHKLRSGGKLQNQEFLSIADFSQSSNARRLYVIDLTKQELLFQVLVAHGRNSGEEFAHSFGNRPQSFKSSLGFFVTGKTYRGQHGTSLKLSGCEPGINDKAEQRGIVIHAADYVSSGFIRSNGRLGRSQGCPAVAAEVCEPLVKCIGGGSCLFIYYPDSAYYRSSKLLR